MKKIGTKHFSVGDTLSTNKGYLFEIVKYDSARQVTIQWVDCGTEEVCTSGNIVNGAVKYLNDQSVFGAGFMGYGRFVPGEKRLLEGQQRLPKHLHRHWRHMLERGLSGVRQIRCYEGVSVCSEWLNMQNFCEWAVLQKNHDAVEDSGRLWHLDKDAILAGNKEYKPDACCFLPNEVNCFFAEKDKGDTGLHGVNRIVGDRSSYKTGYTARCTLGGVREYLGFYDTPEEAAWAYAKHKERAATALAYKWEGIIDDRVVDRLYSFKIVI